MMALDITFLSKEIVMYLHICRILDNFGAYRKLRI